MPGRLPQTRPAVLALILGAATTVALAWLAMFLPPGNAWDGPRLADDLGLWRQGDTKIWSISRGRSAWHTTVAYWHMQSSGRSLWIPAADYEARAFDYRRLPRRFRPGSLADLNVWAWYHATGWPFPALACSVHWKTQIANADIIYTVRGGLQLPRDSEFNPRALPLSPVWWGFALDTAIFGVAWLGLLTAGAAARRRRRTRRARCPHCGYSTAGLPAGAACPECGHT
ncbi:MAG: hypothetical protein WD749_02715 [Phycisphaerales bacterium]